MRTLHQVGDVLLEESFRARTDEASRRLVRHTAHADADLDTAGYVTRWIHQRAQRTRQGTLHRALGRPARARARQTKIQRGIAVVPDTAIAAEASRVTAARIVVIVVLAGLHRCLQVRRQTGGQARRQIRRQIRRHHVVLLRVRRRHHTAHLMS